MTLRLSEDEARRLGLGVATPKRSSHPRADLFEREPPPAQQRILQAALSMYLDWLEDQYKATKPKTGSKAMSLHRDAELTADLLRRVGGERD